MLISQEVEWVWWLFFNCTMCMWNIINLFLSRSITYSVEKEFWDAGLDFELWFENHVIRWCFQAKSTPIIALLFPPILIFFNFIFTLNLECFVLDKWVVFWERTLNPDYPRIWEASPLLLFCFSLILFFYFLPYIMLSYRVWFYRHMQKERI